MASLTLLKLHFQTINLPIQQINPNKLQKYSQFPLHRSILFVSPRCSIASSSSSSSSPTPPNSREQAILQAKISLSSTLEKPLNNPKPSGKLRKSKQPRLRVEIPLIDDSASSLTQLAYDVFGKMSVRRKGSLVKIIVIWPEESLAKSGKEVFDSPSAANVVVENFDIGSICNEGSRVLNSADVAVFLAPKGSDLEVMKRVTEAMNPKPVVIFNPKWSFEDESEFGELSGFVGSFEVVYSFMGLEVRGILSKRKGVIFKCVRDGVLSGERWNVLVEENGDLKLVSSFKARPSIVEVETVLYNLMAINSPITKSAKFLKDLVSNATGKK